MDLLRTYLLTPLLQCGLFFFALLCRLELWRFHRQLQRAEAINRQQLQRLLRHNRDCQWGRDYTFKAIADSADPVASYRQQLPLADYNHFRDAIDAIRNGASDILFPGRPALYVSTSGTSGDAKLYPMTRWQQRSMVRFIAMLTPAVRASLLPGHHLFPRSINLLLASKQQTRDQFGIPIGMSSAGGLRWVLPFAGALWSSPRQVFQLQHHSDALYLHALFALRQTNIQCIEAIFGNHVLAWVQVMHQRQQQLLHDIRHGTLDATLQLSPQQRQRLQQQLAPDPARAEQLAAIFAAGEQQLLSRLWPQLALINCIVSGGFAINRPALQRLLSAEVSFYSGCFGATEAMVGINLEPHHSEHFCLAVGSSYYEFLPLGQTQTVNWQQLQRGQYYQLVISNRAGLYRYQLDDVFELVDFYQQAPVFRFVYRLGTILDLAGEKTTEQQSAAALAAMAQQHWGQTAAIQDYSLCADLSDALPRYKVFVELDRAVEPALQQTLAASLDALLQQSNPAYRTLARQPGRLAALQLRCLPTGSFEQLLQQIMQQQPGLGRNQVKVPRCLQRAEDIALLDRLADKAPV